MKILVTGGAGFIGSAVVRQLIGKGHQVVNVDVLTYAANLDNLASVSDSPLYCHEKADICDQQEISRIISEHQPDAVMHLAAESHVDRSIDGPGVFIHTNVVGTYTMLACARHYWDNLPADKKDAFRFLHISTDEVFGTLGDEGYFTEETPYKPNSPYSASKAGSDHLVRAWHETFGLPVLITNCTNNYGPFQFPEKLVPLMIIKSLSEEALPVYGQGTNVRDWLHVEDHAEALILVLEKGEIGRCYNIGGECEQTNIDVVHKICGILDEISPRENKQPYAELISYVTDRPGHDKRYAMDISRIQRELGWTPKYTFETGFRETIEWYLTNKDWWKRIQDGSYQGQRLGVSSS